MTLNMGQRPFQQIKKLFELRDLRAHGRDIRDKKTIKKEVPYNFVASHTNWAQISQKDAEDIISDIRVAIELINQTRKTPNELLFWQPISSAITTIITTENKG